MGAMESCGCNCGTVATPEKVSKSSKTDATPPAAAGTVRKAPLKRGRSPSARRKSQAAATAAPPAAVTATSTSSATTIPGLPKEEPLVGRESPRWGTGDEGFGDDTNRAGGTVGAPAAATLSQAAAGGKRDEDSDESFGYHFGGPAPAPAAAAPSAAVVWGAGGAQIVESPEQPPAAAILPPAATVTWEPPAELPPSPAPPPEPAGPVVVNAPVAAPVRRPPEPKINPEDLPVDPEVTEGLYLCYEVSASGTFKMVFSKKYVPGAYCYAKPTAPVANHKYQGASRKVNLMTGVQSDRSKFYESWCSFMKQAKMYRSSVILLPHIHDAIYKVHVSFLSEDNEVAHLVYGEWFDTDSSVAALACVSKEAMLGDVKVMDLRVFLQKGHSAKDAASMALE